MPRTIVVFATIIGAALGCDNRDGADPAAGRAGAAAGPAEASRPADPPPAPVVPSVAAMTVSAPAGMPAAPSPAPRRALKPMRLTIEDALASLRAARLDVRDRADCAVVPADVAECCAVAIDGTRVEIFRYDLRVEQHRRALDRRAAAGEVERFGTFAVHRVDHPQMRRVRGALSTFASPDGAER